MRSTLTTTLLALTIASARATCPVSHPHACPNAASVNQVGCPSCTSASFHGPCCDRNPDCVCNAYAGEGYENDGAYGLPRTPVPVGDPDASCTVSEGTVGDYLVGVQWGGARVCTSDGSAAGQLLTGSELAEACLAVCLGDPSCRSFDIGSPLIAEAFRVAEWSQGYRLNCAIEYHRKTEPAVQSIRSTAAPVGSDAEWQVNCWTSYQMGTCTNQPEWAPVKARKCFDPSAATLGGGVFGRTGIRLVSDWFQSGGMEDPVSNAAFRGRLYAIDAETCGGWTVDGAPAVSVTQGLSTTIIIIAAAGAGVLLLVCIIVIVVFMKKKKMNAGRHTSKPTGNGAPPPSHSQMQMTQIPMPVGQATGAAVPVVSQASFGNKFDPNTGKPIPKFDPETGKQNWEA